MKLNIQDSKDLLKMILEKFSLNKKVAVITGGSGILGSIFVNSMLEAGAHVAILDLSENKIANKKKDKVLFIECDITQKSQVENAFKQINELLGPISIVVNNAATKTSNLSNFFKKFEDYDLDTWNEVMSVNVGGMFLVSQEASKYMKKENAGGSIIQISSIYGLLGPDMSIYKGSDYLGHEINTPAVYSASKAAVVGFTKWLSVYLADSNIRVNCIVPGGIESGQNSSFIDAYSNKVPLKRMANAEEMVSTLIHLASDSSSYITGQIISIDGGYSAW